MMNQQPRLILGYAWPHANPGADERMINDNRKKLKEKSIDLMEESEDAAIRSCH